jgi:DNA-directed RNA polymerase subunit RPC12/RpoP
MFIHTDRNGIPIKCANCMKTIEGVPAVKISNSFKEKKIDGPWNKAWSIVYTYYCENCAIKILRKRRINWLKSLIHWVSGVFPENTK